VLASNGDARSPFAREALRKGAVGYVIKDADEDELIEAMRRAVAGQQYVKVAPHVCNEVRPARSKGPLSSRESEVVRLIASGHTNAETASELCLSIRTVEAHRARIHQKLRLSSRAALFEYAVQSGLLEIG